MLSITRNGQTPENPEQSGTWRICCISPSRPILEELTPSLMRCFPGASVREIRQYPSGEALEQEFGSEVPDVCFVDVISGQVRAMALIREILELDGRISVIVLLAATEPDLILKCLHLGATEFLLQPFSADQLQA